jgi:signal transduction histidine kinase
MKLSFASTRKKIALLFAISLSGFILLTTISIIFLVVRQMDTEAEKILSKSLSETIEDFKKNKLEDKTISYQISNKDGYFDSGEYETERLMGRQSESQNINEIRKKAEKKDNRVLSDVLAEEEDQSMVVDFDTLQANKRFFSRVIKSNGDILFSSDLFNALFIDIDEEGFSKQIIEDTCIYLYTTNISSGTYNGYTVQTAQYCPFTPSQQRNLFTTMLAITLFILILTYFAGLEVAKWLLKPLQEAVEQTREFAQNCHHELLTPISVALTTAEASEKSKEYKKGIKSIKEDLLHAYDSLKLLSSRAFHDQAKFSLSRIDVSSILKKALESELKKHNRKDITINKDKIQNNIHQKGDAVSVKLIFQNLLSNSFKYTKKDGVVSISLNNKEFIIKNEIDEKENINIKRIFERHYRGTNGKMNEGKGLGLAIVKELVDLHGWGIDLAKKDGEIIVRVGF